MKRESKEEIIRDIMKNGTWAPESGLYRNLQKNLLKLPYDSLWDLRTIVAIREHDGWERAKEDEQSQVNILRRIVGA